MSEEIISVAEIEAHINDAMEEVVNEEDTRMEEDSVEFPALKAHEIEEGESQFRSVHVPANRLTPLKKHWLDICSPLIKHMKLQVRMNLLKKCVEIRTSEFTTDSGAVQKAADFVNAFMLGFELKDAIALLRLEDIFVESFDIKDVKELHGEHLSRAIGRVAGQGGKTKFTIENATRTRIVVADTYVFILLLFMSDMLLGAFT
jgi:RNA-binding protein PNO1